VFSPPWKGVYAVAKLPPTASKVMAAEAELPPNAEAALSTPGDYRVRKRGAALAEAALQHSCTQGGTLGSAEAKLPPIAEADKGLRPSPTEWERGWE
jgi:hypothetical protein